MKIFPYIYEPDKSIEVFNNTNEYLERNPAIKEKIQGLGWIYHEVGEIIPQTIENFWSGHYFPFSESWDDLQISCTQSFFGLYKQAFVSLRSGLELGLLSVYYNINDDGHKTVADWYSSNDSSDSNTPRYDKIWKILLSNNNIKSFNDKFDLKARFDSLRHLHNYVHTKGIQYSNSFGGIKENSQTFKEKIMKQWLASYEQVVILIATMHLLKYPLATIQFDYFKKFGINMPNFGGLDKYKAEQIASILPIGYMEAIQQIANTDIQTQKTLKEISSMPDLTDDEIEKQALDVEKFSIEHGEGFVEWEKQQGRFMDEFIALNTLDDYSDYKKVIFSRIEALRIWAEENNFMDPKEKQLGWKR